MSVEHDLRIGSETASRRRGKLDYVTRTERVPGVDCGGRCLQEMHYCGAFEARVGFQPACKFPSDRGSCEETFKIIREILYYLHENLKALSKSIGSNFRLDRENCIKCKPRPQDGPRFGADDKAATRRVTRPAAFLVAGQLTDIV